MNNKEFNFLDIITIISFMVGLEAFELAQKNLVENRQQTEDTHKILFELHLHSHIRIISQKNRFFNRVLKKCPLFEKKLCIMHN